MQWFLMEMRPRSGPMSRWRWLHPWRLRKQWSHFSTDPIQTAQPNYRRWTVWINNKPYYWVNNNIVTRSLFCLWRGFWSANWYRPHLKLRGLPWWVQELEWLPVVHTVLWGRFVRHVWDHDWNSGWALCFLQKWRAFSALYLPIKFLLTLCFLLNRSYWMYLRARRMQFAWTLRGWSNLLGWGHCNRRGMPGMRVQSRGSYCLCPK